LPTSELHSSARSVEAANTSKTLVIINHTSSHTTTQQILH
jgi:hypothetical protein